MKQFIIYFLILMFPFSQKEIVSFEEIKNIHSFETFEKIMIEKGFELYPEERIWTEQNEFIAAAVGLKLDYSYNLNPSTDNAEMWAAWYNDNTFRFDTVRDIDYSNVFSDVKNECEFYGVLESRLKERHSCYTCPGSKYTGKICFMKQTIRTLIPD